MPPRYDHRDVWWGVWCACCSVCGVLLCGVVGGCGLPAPAAAVCSGVGGGLVVVCIVDAGLCSVRVPPGVGGVWCAPFCPAPPYPWCV